MKIQAVGNYTILNLIQKEKRKSGVYLPDDESSPDRGRIFEVVSVGCKAKSLGWKPGDTVVGDRVGMARLFPDQKLFAAEINKIFGVVK